jgi:hypothetical protein
MMESIENKWITATIAMENEVAGKAQMPEVRRRVVTRAAYPAHLWRISRHNEGIYAVSWCI